MPQRKGLAPLIRKTKLRYPEMSEAQIARRVGCVPSNVHAVLSGFLGGHSQQDLRDFQANKAEIYDAIQHRILESITQDKLTKTSAPGLVTAAAILEDKARLVRGQATSLNMAALLDVVDLIRAKRNE